MSGRLIRGALAVAVAASLVGCGTVPGLPGTSSRANPTAAQDGPDVPSTAQSEGRTASVIFEVTGSGTVYTIDTDPSDSSGSRPSDVALPWRRTITVGPDVQLLQVVAVGRSSPGPGCRISVDGAVVAEQPVGGSAHCTYRRE